MAMVDRLVVDESPVYRWWLVLLQVASVVLLFLTADGWQLVQHPAFRLAPLLAALVMPIAVQYHLHKRSRELDPAGRRVASEFASIVGFQMYLAMLMLSAALRG